MMKTKRKGGSMKRGFTLVEVLLALSIGMMVLMSATSLLYSMGKVWANEQSGGMFYQHANHLEIFLRQNFEKSIRPTTTARVRWERPPEWSEFDDPLLCFNLDESPAFLYQDGAPLYHLTCYIYFTKEDSLCFLWYSKQYEVESESDLYLTQISPYVTAMSYLYYDSDKEEWNEAEIAEKERGGKWKLPQALRFTLTHEDEERTVTITLPTKQQFPIN